MRIEKTELVAFILLGIGTILLILTFYMAYTLVAAELSIVPTPDLSETLGEILGPITEAIIRVMYLGIMGWIGSIATIRGVQLIKDSRRVPEPKPEQLQESIKDEEKVETTKKSKKA